MLKLTFATAGAMPIQALSSPSYIGIGQKLPNVKRLLDHQRPTMMTRLKEHARIVRHIPRKRRPVRALGLPASMRGAVIPPVIVKEKDQFTAGHAVLVDKPASATLEGLLHLAQSRREMPTQQKQWLQWAQRQTLEESKGKIRPVFRARLDDSLNPAMIRYDAEQRLFYTSKSVPQGVDSLTAQTLMITKKADSGILPLNHLLYLRAAVAARMLRSDLTLLQYRKAALLMRMGKSIPAYWRPQRCDEIPLARPVAHLTRRVRRGSGRGGSGRIQVHHRGGGGLRRIRILDSMRAPDNIGQVLVSGAMPGAAHKALKEAAAAANTTAYELLSQAREGKAVPLSKDNPALTNALGIAQSVLKPSLERWVIVRIERDPNRTARLALVRDLHSGRLSYRVAIDTMRAGCPLEPGKNLDCATEAERAKQQQLEKRQAREAARGHKSRRYEVPKENLWQVAHQEKSANDAVQSASTRTYEAMFAQVSSESTAPTKVASVTTEKVSSNSFTSNSSSSSDQLLLGLRLPLAQLPLGTTIHDISLRPESTRGQLVRAAGTFAQIVSRDEAHFKYCDVRLPSGRTLRLDGRCLVTVGRVGRTHWSDEPIGKAGKQRWRGRRPVVRGMAMNAVDHPHGGGKDRQKGSHSMSRWGWICK